MLLGLVLVQTQWAVHNGKGMPFEQLKIILPDLSDAFTFSGMLTIFWNVDLMGEQK